MSPKRTSAALISLMLLVAACGSDDETSDGGPESTEASSNATTAEDGPAASDAETSDTGTGSSTAGTDGTTEPAGDTPQGGSLTYGVAYDTSGGILDPHKMARQVDYFYSFLTYDALIDTTNTGELVPGLATSWDLSDDGLTLTMQLRDDVVFHDGAAFDAEAAKANLERAKEPENLTSVQLATMDTVEATGDYEITLHLNQPGASLLANLAGFSGMMISPAAFDDPNLSVIPVGTGPYVLVDRSDTTYEFEKFADYWDADNVALDHITYEVMRDATARYNALVAGQIDVASLTPDRVEDARAEGIEFATSVNLLPYSLIFDASTPGLDEPLVRQAMSHAVDRDAINEAVFGGTCAPTAQIYPESFWAHNPDIDFDEWASYDPDKARALMAEAGYADGFSMEIVAPSNFEPLTRLAQIMQAQLGEIGIEVSIISVEGVQFTPAYTEGQGDSIMALVLADLEPTVTFDKYYLPGGRRHELNPPGAAELIDEARGELDLEARAQLIHDATVKVLENGMPSVNLCHRTDFLGFQPRVGGVVIPIQSSPGFDINGIFVED